jgi:dTDP-4-amino-4,6-dideoxygalactose transaminase
LPLFQDPEPLFPHHPAAGSIRYQPGQFPVAEHIHHHTLKLPVWHREEDMPLVRRYVEGFAKVVEHHHELER